MEENGDALAKTKLREAVQECLDNLDPLYRYKDNNSNEYSAQFDLISIDGKRVVKVDASLDKQDNLQVYAGGGYKDEDFEFEIDEVNFDMLQFKNITNCVNHIMAKISLKASMKINGTRFRIGANVFVITPRDLAKVRADLIHSGTATIYSQQGVVVILDKTGQNQGKVVDKVAQRLISQNNDKLYYTVDLNAAPPAEPKLHTLEK